MPNTPVPAAGGALPPAAIYTGTPEAPVATLGEARTITRLLLEEVDVARGRVALMHVASGALAQGAAVALARGCTDVEQSLAEITQAARLTLEILEALQAAAGEAGR